MDEPRDQPSLGKTFFTIIVTNFVQNWENLRNSIGIFSCEMLAFCVKIQDLRFYYLTAHLVMFFLQIHLKKCTSIENTNNSSPLLHQLP